MSSACHQRVISVSPAVSGSVSSACHQRVTSVSPACHQRVISVSSACHQQSLAACHQRVTSVSPACHQRVISVSSVCHQRCFGRTRCELRMVFLTCRVPETELRYIGTLHWYIGTLVHGYIGTSVHWYIGALVHWCNGTSVGTSAHGYIGASSLDLSFFEVVAFRCAPQTPLTTLPAPHAHTDRQLPGNTRKIKLLYSTRKSRLKLV